MSKADDNTQTPVIIYSTDWCGFCKMAKQYLTQKNVPFVEKNVEHDYEAYQEFQKKMGGHSGVPVLDIDGKLILGFDRPAIDAALAGQMS
jgi:glutaredoxin-like YruB-family protein